MTDIASRTANNLENIEATVERAELMEQRVVASLGDYLARDLSDKVIRMASCETGRVSRNSINRMKRSIVMGSRLLGAIEMGIWTDRSTRFVLSPMRR